MSSQSGFVENVLHGQDKGIGATLLRGLLTGAAWMHRIGLEAYLLPYHTGTRHRHRLMSAEKQPVPTIAIGNLTSGGTGKTPMAALVAQTLQDSGRRVVLLSRGYGGRGKDHGRPRIVTDGDHLLLRPEEAGDEPALLAWLLPGVPIFVGKDRRLSGQMAIERFQPDVVVLDDALQFWQLHRDLDIVLLDARRPFDNGYVLPRGLLREPPSHLKRAGIVVLTRADRVDPLVLHATQARVKRLAPRAAVFTAIHAPLGWVRASDGALLPLDTLKNQQILLFAGIADSDSFVSTAKALGVRILHRRDFGDHHAYTSQEVAALARIRCEAAITTEKDLVKVALHWPRQAPPLYALRVGMELDDPSRFEAALRKTLQEMHKPATEGMPTTAAAPPPAPRVSPPEATEVKNELTEVETEEAKPAEIKEPDPLLPPSEPVSAAEMKRARVPLPSRHDNPRPNGHRPRPTRRNGNPDPPHDS